MATIETRKNSQGKVSYRVKIRPDGCKPISKTFARKTDAVDWATRLEADIKRGIHLPTPQSMRRTLADLIDRYFEEELPKRRSDADKYKSMLMVWKKKAGHLFLKDVTPSRIAEIREELANQITRFGKKPSAQTVKHYLNALSACMVWAVRDLDWLEDNPVSKVKKPSTARTSRIRYLEDHEKEPLLAAVKASKSPYLYPLVVLALSTGARWSEMLTLKWRHVDLQNGTVRFENTKNGDSRTVPLGRVAIEMLHEVGQKYGTVKSDWVFKGTDGSHADPRTAWEAVLERSGIKDFRFHDLRHTAASYMTMEGIDLLRVGEVLGHRSIQMTKKYSHLAPQHTQIAIDKLDRKLFGSSSESNDPPIE